MVLSIHVWGIVAVVLAVFCSHSTSAQDLDALETYRHAPLCLRTCSKEELEAIPGFSWPLSGRLLAIVRNDSTTTIDRIADTLCLTIAQRILLHACTTLDCWQGAPAILMASWRGSTRLTEIAATQDSLWLGPATDATLRADVRYGTHRLALVAARAAGEPQLVEHIGGSLAIDASILLPCTATVLVGDFSPSFGQGLVFGTAADVRGPWTSALAPRTMDAAVRPWTSAQRYGGLRGGALVVSIGSLHGSLATSRRNLIGTIRTDASGEYASAIDRVMARRTLAERTRTNIAEHIDMATVGMTLGKTRVDLLAAKFHYSVELRSTAASVLPGRGGTFVAASLSTPIRGSMFGGEIARGAEGDIAIAAGWTKQWTGAKTILALRCIPAAYRAPYAATRTDATAVSNEVGVTLGATVRFPDGRCDAVADVRQTLDRTYGVPARVFGMTFDCLGTVRLGHATMVGWRVFWERETDGQRDSMLGRTIATQRERLRCRLDAAKRVTGPLSLRIRLDVGRVSWDVLRPTELGLALTTSARYVGPRISIGVQWSVFSTDSYESAITVGEVTMPGTLRSVAFIGAGSRMATTVRMRIVDHLDVYGALTNAQRMDVQRMGSGPTETAGPRDVRISLGVVVRIQRDPPTNFLRSVLVDDEAGTGLE